MKNAFFLSAVALTVALAADAGTIVLPAKPTDVERTAARELSDALRRTTGERWAISAEGGHVAAGEKIYLGATEVAKKVSPASWKPDEVLMKRVSEGLVLTGHPVRGPIYAADVFQEKILGVRWWTSTEATYPTFKDFKLPDVDYRHAPPFAFRETYFLDSFDADFKVRMKGNVSSLSRYMLSPLHFIPKEKGGDSRFHLYKGRNSAYHSFFEVLPPAKHFAAHPAWYSLVGGKRVAKQLCLTNPEMEKAYIAETLRQLREDPEADIIQVSQNDGPGACECAACRAIEAEEGGAHAAPLLRFVNRVAEAIEREFPHVTVDTFAYQYTRQAPTKTRPRRNVTVRLCDIECSFAEPLETGVGKNAAFLRDLEAWTKVADGRLYVWDYVANFRSYILPHPNLRALAPNVRLFAKSGAVGLFEQGDVLSAAGDFCRLKQWVLAHLLWDPSQDENALIGEFVRGYYGEAAAPHVLRYLSLVNDRAAREGLEVGCYHFDVEAFMTDDEVRAAEHELASAVAASPEPYRARLVREKLAIDHVLLLNWDRLGTRGGYLDAAKRWVGDCRRFGVVAYCETTRRQEFEDYFAKLLRTVEGPLRHFGCAYYPEAWDEANWARDLDEMRELGMDIVRIGEFNWGKFEPEEGRFDFAAFHRFLDVCRDKGMKVLMCTPTAAQPKWMQSRYPETVRTLKDGSKPVQDLRQTACLTSPKFRSFADRIVTKMAESFKDRAEIVGWQLDNELYSASSGGLCVCDACQRGFRAAMKRRYGTVENMNRALNGAFWSGDFASFDDIVLPFGNRQAWMREMVRFHGEELVSLVHGHRDILRKANPKWRITTNNPCCSGNLRYDTLFGGLDLVSCDHYVSMKGLPRWRWEWTMFRGLSGRQQPFLLGETGAFNYATDSARTFDSLKPWLWDAIAHGMDSVCYFRWRMSVIGEDDHPAILSWSGEKGIAYGKIRDMIREMDALPVRFARLEPERTSVAILHDAAAAQFEYARTVNAMVGTAPDVLSMQVHTALERFGVTPEIVQVSQLADLSHYRLVFLPACMTIDAGLAAKLRDFVRKGGRVVALTRLACLEPEGGAYPKAAYPVGMTDLFGLEVLDRSGLRTVPQGEFGWFSGCKSAAVKLDFPYGDFTAKGTIEYARTTTAKTLATYSSTCYAGCPLLTANDVGKGRAYYLTAAPDASGTKSLVRQLLREIGEDVSREWPLEVTRVVRGGHTLVVNTSEEEQAVPDEPGVLLFGRLPRKLADGRMAIAPYDVLIYRSCP